MKLLQRSLVSLFVVLLAKTTIPYHHYHVDNVLHGHTDISVKTEFKPRVTLGGILSEQNLELLVGQL